MLTTDQKVGGYRRQAEARLPIIPSPTAVPGQGAVRPRPSGTDQKGRPRRVDQTCAWSRTRKPATSWSGTNAGQASTKDDAAWQGEVSVSLATEPTRNPAMPRRQGVAAT